MSTPAEENGAAERTQAPDDVPVTASMEPAQEAPPAPAPDEDTFDLRLFPDEKIGAPALVEPELAPAPVVDAPQSEQPTDEESAPEAADAAVDAGGRLLPAGLIADEDLARLAEEDMTLAPLDTLDVVGAYDSGGVRFTMYSDGSVNAVAPHGTRRYHSLEALRKQLDAGLPAV